MPTRAGWSCHVGKTRERSGIGRRSHASLGFCPASFLRPFCRAHLVGRLCRRRRGWLSIPIGARIHCAPIGWHGRWPGAAERLPAGRGGLAEVARVDCLLRSACRPHPTANALLPPGAAFAACAGKRFTGSAGMSICGTAVQTKMPTGIAPASLPGSSGTHRATRWDFCAACRPGAASRPADGCGRPPRSITGCRCFGCGANGAIHRGRCCWTIGLAEPPGHQSRRARRQVRDRGPRSA